MKKVLAVLVILAIGLALLDSERRPDVHASGGGGSSLGTGGDAPAVCGDVNLDGSLDISDAIRILGYLFAGGSAPTCATQNPEPSRLQALEAKIAATGDPSVAVMLDHVLAVEGTPPLTFAAGQVVLLAGDQAMVHNQSGETRILPILCILHGLLLLNLVLDLQDAQDKGTPVEITYRFSACGQEVKCWPPVLADPFPGGGSIAHGREQLDPAAKECKRVPADTACTEKAGPVCVEIFVSTTANGKVIESTSKDIAGWRCN